MIHDCIIADDPWDKELSDADKKARLVALNFWYNQSGIQELFIGVPSPQFSHVFHLSIDETGDEDA